MKYKVGNRLKTKNKSGNDLNLEVSLRYFLSKLIFLNLLKLLMEHKLSINHFYFYYIFSNSLVISKSILPKKIF